MLLDLLQGKKKKGFFSRKFAKLRGRNKKKDDDKDDKQDKKDSKKSSKEMEKAKAKNKATTRLAMKEAMGEVPVETPNKVAKEGNIGLRDSITSKGRDRRESVADKMLNKQMAKYKQRFGFKKNAPLEYSPEL
jgi:hypothetical protein